jgi:hypothetical protein
LERVYVNSLGSDAATQLAAIDVSTDDSLLAVLRGGSSGTIDLAHVYTSTPTVDVVTHTYYADIGARGDDATIAPDFSKLSLPVGITVPGTPCSLTLRDPLPDPLPQGYDVKAHGFDLHLSAHNSECHGIELTPVVDTDIDGQARDTAAPDAGADELH